MFNIENNTILVIGDVMLDKYYFSDVKRISPEAPVPIAKVVEERSTLGGAANVAHNLALLGCHVLLGGVTGDDDNRRHLLKLLEEKGIDHSGVLITARPTIAKLRIIGAHQQMMRLDFEEIEPLDEVTLTQMQEWFQVALATGVDAVVISDYAKGVCTPALCQYVIAAGAVHGIPVLVDPKGSNWDKYSGAAYITPNMKELSEAVGVAVANTDAQVALHAADALKRFKLGTVIATRSEKGLSLVSSGQIVHIPTRAEEVFDVSGAGDTVVAVLAAGLAGGLDPVKAAHLANLAAGVVVGKVGTYAISQAELAEAVRQSERDSRLDRKIMENTAEAVQLTQTWRNQGHKIVFTNGCFDILHAGHVAFLEKARDLGNRLIIGLNADVSVRSLKGPKRPIVHETDRAKLLAALECVDAVVLFDEDTPAKLVHAIKPDILAKGADYRPEDIAGRQDAGKIEIIPLEKGKSTTGIIESILDGYSAGKLQ